MNTIAADIFGNIADRRSESLSTVRTVGAAFVLGVTLAGASLSSVYPRAVNPGGELAFTSWWDNQGVAPCYKKFPLALRLKTGQRVEVLLTRADITTWLPGDNLFDSAVAVPTNLPAGDYDLELALLDPLSKAPKVKLAIGGRAEDGWYQLGTIKVEGKQPAKSR